MQIFNNPFRPGAGQQPPYLAGRDNEKNEFDTYLKQKPVLKNLIITGLRGVGKTVLLDTLKPVAIDQGWLWAGTDLSESAGLSEVNLSIRIMTDISTLIAGFPIHSTIEKKIGFNSEYSYVDIHGGYEYLEQVYNLTPGLETDKLKNVLETVWNIVKSHAKGIVLAYDEAQILKDKANDKQYPLSLLLEVIQFLQRKEIPYLLVLTGLPTLYPHLIEARTYAERMFHIMTLDKLNEAESKEAIIRPFNNSIDCTVRFTDKAISEIIQYSGGYPYFIQFICKETFDSYLQQIKVGIDPKVTIPEIVRKLDTDFYSGRWIRLTERQKEILKIISSISLEDEEFSVIDIVEKSKNHPTMDGFSASNANQILTKLTEIGMIYKNRHGKYSFAVPLMANFIKRQG